MKAISGQLQFGFFQYFPMIFVPQEISKGTHLAPFALSAAFLE
jgi:hypothetical protein